MAAGMIKMNRVVILAWFSPVVFMAVAFYVLFRSETPTGTKIVLTALPVVIWMIGGVAVYREFHGDREERRKQEQVLNEAKKILGAGGRRRGVYADERKEKSGSRRHGRSSPGKSGRDEKA